VDDGCTGEAEGVISNGVMGRLEDMDMSSKPDWLEDGRVILIPDVVEAIDDSSGVRLELLESRVDAVDDLLVNRPKGSRCLGPVLIWSASVAYVPKPSCCVLPSSYKSYSLRVVQATLITRWIGLT